MTGIVSGKVFQMNMEEAVAIACDTNEKFANEIGINKAARVTCVKPSGTTSCVLGTSSGVHAWHNDYYIRRIRVGKNETIYRYLAQQHPELLEDDYFRPQSQACISIPIKAPSDAILRDEDPVNTVERVKKNTLDWIKPGHRQGINTHNVSCTISIKPYEWNKVGEWIWDNRNICTGFSCLPYSEHTYIQTPFEDCTKERYAQLHKSLRVIDLTRVEEEEDHTQLNNELACSNGSCELQ